MAFKARELVVRVHEEQDEKEPCGCTADASQDDRFTCTGCTVEYSFDEKDQDKLQMVNLALLRQALHLELARL
jgi:hypothetical protein